MEYGILVTKSLLSEAWNYYLNEIKADFFLFQEAKPTDELFLQKDHMIWDEIGGTCKWGSGIYSPTNKLTKENIKTDFKGSIVIANSEVISERLTLISMYGQMEGIGPTHGYAITNLHRMLSDLTGLFNGHLNGKRKIILGGDLNASTQLDKTQGNNSHRIFFDRLTDFKLQDVFALSGNKDYVQTLRHNISKVPWQNDYMFISISLSEKFLKYEIIDNEHVRKFSDHNILIIEMDI